jgi:hypothetical protein
MFFCFTLDCVWIPQSFLSKTPNRGGRNQTSYEKDTKLRSNTFWYNSKLKKRPTRDPKPPQDPPPRKKIPSRTANKGVQTSTLRTSKLKMKGDARQYRRKHQKSTFCIIFNTTQKSLKTMQGLFKMRLCNHKINHTPKTKIHPKTTQNTWQKSKQLPHPNRGLLVRGIRNRTSEYFNEKRGKK